MRWLERICWVGVHTFIFLFQSVFINRASVSRFRPRVLHFQVSAVCSLPQLTALISLAPPSFAFAFHLVLLFLWLPIPLHPGETTRPQTRFLIPLASPRQAPSDSPSIIMKSFPCVTTPLGNLNDGAFIDFNAYCLFTAASTLLPPYIRRPFDLPHPTRQKSP